MNKLGIILIAMASFAACGTKAAPPASSSATSEPNPSSAATSAQQAPAAAPAAAADATNVDQKLQEIAGSGAKNCGQVKSLSGDDIKTASDCALDAAKNKKAFRVSYGMPGMTVGIAGGSDGKLFTVQSEEENGKAVAKTQPCPAELRVAQSGRVTCFPPGQFGVAPGAANPHAGQGASPHGGAMGTPAPGTPNPHKQAPAPQKSH